MVTKDEITNYSIAIHMLFVALQWANDIRIGEIIWNEQC